MYENRVLTGIIAAQSAEWLCPLGSLGWCQLVYGYFSPLLQTYVPSFSRSFRPIQAGIGTGFCCSSPAVEPKQMWY